MRRFAAYPMALLLLAPAGASAQGGAVDDFTFPSNGDEALGDFGRVFFRAGDGYRGSRELEVDECDSISGTFRLAQNQLREGDNCVAHMRVLITGEVAGDFSILIGEEAIEVGPLQPDESVGGPEYRFEIQMTEDIEQGCGSITVELGTSTWECEDIQRPGENRRPSCEAGGPYVCDEGSELQLDSTGEDPDGDDVVIEWDLDGDGDFNDARGDDPLVDCAAFDGPANREITMRVTDEPAEGDALTRTCFGAIQVNNVAPDFVGDEFSPPVIGAENVPYEFCLNAEDPSPFDTPEYELLRGPNGASIVERGGETGCIDWVPAAEQVRDAPYNFEVRISDDDGGVSTRAWPVTVVADANTPSAFAGEDVTIEPCKVEICCLGTDPRGLALTYEWSQVDEETAPSVVFINEEQAASPCLTLPVAGTGTYTFQCVVTNEEGLISPTDRVEVTVANQPPTCDAGFDSTCFVEGHCTLDGRRSSDPNADPMRFRWVQTSPEDRAVRLSGATNSITSFVPLSPGIYCFNIECYDQEFEGDPEEVCVTVHQTFAPDPRGGDDRPADHVPVANCGESPLYADVGDKVRLEGLRSYDPDGFPLVDYRWEQVSGPRDVQLEADEEDPHDGLRFFRPREEGVYVFSLRVQDTPPHELDYATEHWSLPCTVAVQAADDNQPPIADPGLGATQSQGNIAEFDGTNSRDSDGDELGYSWIQLRGPRITLQDADTAMPSFQACTPGIYQFELTVNDGRVDSLPAEVWATVTSPCNEAPIANAGQNFVANCSDGVPGTVEDRIILDGRQTFDSDGNFLKYQWIQIGGLPVDLQREFNERPYCEPTQWDIYTFRLFALDFWTEDIDGEDPPDCWQPAWSLPQDVRVVVNCDDNAIPAANAGPDQEWLLGDLVVIDGCDSRDDDGDELTYTWRKAEGPDLGDAVDGWGTCALGFPADETGEWIFCLRVADGFATSLEDCGTHRVIPNNNEAPVCRVPPRTFTRPGHVVSLVSGSFDSNADELLFLWEQLEGPTVQVTAADEWIASFRAPAVPEGADTVELKFQLTVDDQRADPTSCTTRVTVTKDVDICAPANPNRPAHCLNLPTEGEGEEGEGEDPDGLCNPGVKQTCTCPGGSGGERICQQTGRWADCICSGSFEGEGEGSTPPTDPGCGCRLASGAQPSGDVAWLSLVGLALLGWRRRR
jgi:MYXO-CTERM domain-containing protein